MLRPRTRPKRESITTRIRSAVQRPLVSGLLVVVPLGITVFVLKFLYDFTAGRLAPLVKRFVEPTGSYAVPVFSVILMLLGVYLIGMITSAVVGRRLIAFAEAFIQRIPIVKSVYGASKQIVEALSFQKKGAEPRTVALIEFPYAGMKTMGFLTGKLRLGDGRVYYKVFVPTTPNITVGLFELVAQEDVYRCDIPMDEAVKMVVSGGIIGPERLKLRRATQDPPEAAPSSDEDEET